MKYKARKALEDAVWARTHQDYRHTGTDGVRSVLWLIDGVTTLMPLGSLTDKQLLVIAPP